MNKSLKILLLVCATLVTLCIAAVFVAMVAIDPNEYKEEIAQLVRDKTGRELTFEGNIGLSFFPYVGFNVGPVSLGNAPGFSEPEMARIKRAEVSIRLVPLFSGKVAVGEVVLEGLSVHLARNEQSVGNWEDLAGGENAATEPSSSADDSAGSDEAQGGMSLDAISVQGVTITNAYLFYADLQKRSESSIGNLNLTLGEIHGTESFPFELAFDLKLDQPRIMARPMLSGDIQVDPAAGAVALDNLSLSAFDLQLAGSVQASNQGGTPTFSGSFRLAETSLRELLEKFGTRLPEMADPTALGRFSAAMEFDGTDDSVRLESLLVKLDDTTLSAQGAVSHFAAPEVSLVALVDEIDADRYLPPKKATDAQAQPEPPFESSRSEHPMQEPDLSALRNLALDARLEVGGCKVMNLNVSDILVDVSVHDGVVLMSPFSLNLYDGHFESHAQLDANGELALWAGSGLLQGLDTRTMVHALLGKEMISGAASVEYDLGGSGLTPESVKQSVCGEANLAVTDGSVVGVDVAKMIRDGWNQIMGADVHGEESGDFDFSSLTASAKLKNGHIVNNDLIFDSPLVEVSGGGWADLPKNATDYKALVTVVGSLDGLEGEILEAVRDVPLPLEVKGALDQPSFGLDMQAMSELLVTAGIGIGLDIVADSLLGGLDDESDEYDEYDEYDDEDDFEDDGEGLLGDLF